VSPRVVYKVLCSKLIITRHRGKYKWQTQKNKKSAKADFLFFFVFGDLGQAVPWVTQKNALGRYHQLHALVKLE
jgi:hypothetical protein